jgi:hypothetical protein
VNDRCPADCGWVPKARRRLTCIDAPAELCLELEVEATGGTRLPLDFSQAEGPCQKCRRRLGVLVEQVRSDGLSHGADCRRRSMTS